MKGWCREGCGWHQNGKAVCCPRQNKLTERQGWHRLSSLLVTGERWWLSVRNARRRAAFVEVKVEQRETSSKNLNGRASATSRLQRTDTCACTWLSRTTFYIFVRGADYFTPVLTSTSFTPLANRLDFELSPISFSPHKNKLVAQLLIQCWGAAATPEEEEEILLELLGFWWLGFGVFIAVMSNDREWP